MKSKRELFVNVSMAKGAFGFFFLLFVWSSLSYTGIVESFFLPTPSAVFHSTISLFLQFDLLSDIIISVYRILIGFTLAAFVAIPIGILVGTNKSFESFIEPIVAFVRYIPPSAFVPLSILWLGIGDVEKFFIIFIGVAPYLLVLVADAIANVKKEYLEAGYTLGATTEQLYTKIIIPSALPGIWDAVRLMFGATWTFIILVEIIAAPSGLGHVIVQSQRFLQTSTVIAVILVIGLLGLVTDFLFKAGYRYFFPWAERVN